MSFTNDKGKNLFWQEINKEVRVFPMIEVLTQQMILIEEVQTGIMEITILNFRIDKVSRINTILVLMIKVNGNSLLSIMVY